MKREQLRQELAKEVMRLKVGEQVPTIRQYSQRFKSSLGTVQSVLAEFEEAGAVRIERRGWMGTFLHDRDLSRLWSIARNGSPLVIAFPLPSTRICEGLATAVKEQLSRSQIETFLIFLRGSRNRLQALRQQRCHAVAVSSFAAKLMCGPGERPVLDLPPHTYIQEHRVFYAPGVDPYTTSHLRVGMDHSSIDIQCLTELEFAGKDVQFVDTNYMRYAEMLNKRQVDAVIWDIDETFGRLGVDVNSRPLSDHVVRQIGHRNTQACFVAGIDDVITETVLNECVQTDELLAIQGAVMEGSRVPEY
jgi:hypothetical protein